MTTAPARVVGIDGGATRTRYLLADATGGILARSEGKGSLLGAGEDRSVADDLVREVGTLASRAGTGLPVDALCAGLAGADRRPDARALLGDRLSQLGVSRRVRIVPDAEVAFVDAFGEAAGILLIAGTGSIGLGRAGGGELERVGGWGALLGDEGSGYRIGLDGLQAAIRGAERRGPPTGLSDTLFRSLGLESVARVLEWGQGAGKSRIAVLAPLVIQEAERGDAVAVEIVDRAVAGLVGHAQALAKKLETPAPRRVALVGGLIEERGPLRARVAQRLAKEGFEPVQQLVYPARGAVRLALQLE